MDTGRKISQVTPPPSAPPLKACPPSWRIRGGRGSYAFVGNKGVATIFVAIFMTLFILGFLVVGIDFARMYYVRGEIQNAADAAALAGAKVMAVALWNNPADLGGATSAATTEAGKFANNNKVAGTAMTLSAGDVKFGQWNESTKKCDGSLVECNNMGGTGTNAISVKPQRLQSKGNPVSLIFSKVIPGLESMDVSRSAIAKIKPLVTPALAICPDTCPVSQGGSLNPSALPVNLSLQGGTYPLWYTDFISTGGNSANDFLPYIGGQTPPNFCGQVADVNDGVINKDLTNDENGLLVRFQDPNFFRGDKDIVNEIVTGWTVTAAVIDSCHPGNNKSVIRRVATLKITKVVSATTKGKSGEDKGVWVSSISCFGCSPNLPFGQSVMLVK